MHHTALRLPFALAGLLLAVAASAQTAAPAVARPAAATGQKPAATAPTPPPGVTPPSGYVIGPEDVLAVLFWREKDLSVDVSVRPDGMITLPLVNDLKAAGLTPDQLREAVQKAAAQFVEDPNVTIVVKQINSRKVFVTGQVAKPGTYPLIGETSVLQMIATAGGLADFAKGDRIVIMRTRGGKTETLKFNYKDVIKGKKLEQNILLLPGDTIVVP
jgi:polysaccharide export outer membrane protein